MEHCVIVGITREAHRSAAQRDELPYSTKAPEGGQRTYNGADALAFELFAGLRGAGVSARSAADRVRISGAPEHFLRALRRRENIHDWSFATFTLLRTGARSDDVGIHDLYSTFFKNSDELSSRLEGINIAYLEARGHRTSGLRELFVVPLLAAYDRAKGKALEAGYSMDGFGITKLRIAS